MTVHARVEGGEVREVVETPPGTPLLRDRYPPALLRSFVPVPPAQARLVAQGWLWDGAAFRPPPPPAAPPVRFIPAGVLRERMEAAGLWDEMAALLVSLLPTRPGLVLKLLTLNEGVAADDPEARQLIAAAGGDPDAILA